MATLMPLSDANCHICLSHHGRVVMLLEKRCLHNHKCCGLGFYSPCYILFLTCKSPKSQSPQGVPTESPQSPWGTVRGLLGESPICGDYIGSPSGLLGDSLETPWGLLGDSLGTGRTSAKLGLIPKESLGDSSGTPQGLPGLPGDSLGLLGDSLGTPQQRVAQCNDLAVWAQK